MIQWILNLIFCLLLVGCTPTNESLTELIGETTTKTKTGPGDLGNQAFTFTPASYDFGNRAVNAAPISKTITIKNISSYDVYVSSVTGPAASFSLVSDNCPRAPINMSPNSSCSAVVNFAPIAGGVLTSSLTINYGPSTGDTTAYTSAMGLSGTGVGTLAFNGIDSITNIFSTQMQLNWTHVAGALVYYVFRVNADGSNTLIANITAPTANYIVSGLTANTSYKFWVRAVDTIAALDTNTNIVTTSTNNTPPSPVLSGHADYTFASIGAISVGATLSLDFNDVRTGVSTDAGVTYSCGYDQVVNNSVTASANCGALPSGTSSFSTTSGALSWTGSTNGAIGFYEFKVMVTDNSSGLTNQAIFVVDVKPSYSTSNLIGNYSAMFSSGAANQSTATSWQDLTSTNADGTLTNFTFGGPYGWQGNGAATSPYSITFDGTNDYVDVGTQASGASSMSLEAWYKPTTINSNPIGYIVGNGGTGNKGLTLREARGYRNRVEGFIGDKTYADELLADSPYAYLRMGEVSGDTPYDIGSGGLSWTLGGVTSYELTSPLGGNDKAICLSSSGTGYYTGNVVNTSVGGWTGVTYEAWARFDSMVPTYPTIFSHDIQQSGRTFYWLFMNGPNNLSFQYVADGAVRSVGVAFTPVLGTWYHIAATLDFTTKAIALYINGASVSSTTAPYATILQSNDNAQVKFGTYSVANGTYALIGGMDEAAIYKSALSSARIAAHYNAKANYYELISNRMTNNVYNHHALTFDEFTSSLNLFTNSVNEANTSTAAITLNGSASNFALGAKLPSTGSPTANTFSSGAITDARVYNVELGANTIRNNMSSQISQFEWPKAHSNLIMWFDASDLSTLYTTTDCVTTPVANNGDAVACWKDKSGNNNHVTQGTPAQKPTYKSSNASLNNMPSLTFGATAYSLLTSASLTFGARTYFAVTKTNGVPTGTYHTLLIQNASPFYQMYASNTTAYFYSGAANAATTSYVGQQLHTIVNSTSAGSSALSYRVNQVAVITNSAVAANLSGTFSVGGYGPGAYGFNGEILEVIIYDRALSNSEVFRIEGYLKAKYGF